MRPHSRPLSLLLWPALLSLSFWASTSAAQRRPAVRTRGALARTIAKLLSPPSLSSAQWGISLVSLSGRPIYSLNDAQLFRPASNAKLFTTAAAFALLPGGLTFTTRVLADGNVDAAGTVHGNLLILGVGDANISGRTVPYDGKTERPNPPLAALEDMADQIVRRGIHVVDGGIVGDDSWFPYERYPSGWSWDDLEWSYGAPISALTVNDNAVYLTAMPGAQVGEPAIASWLPSTSYYTLENSLITAAGTQEPGIERQPGSLTVRLFGQLALGQQGIHVGLAIEDPADYAARSLKEMLLARGVQVRGAAQARHRFASDTQDFLAEQEQPLDLHAIAIDNLQVEQAPGETVLAAHISPPLGQDLVVTNKVSQNLHAELTLRTLGKLDGSDGSAVQGTRVVRQFLIQAGIDPEDFFFYDGSGLSPNDLVTPRAFTTLLTYAAQQSWGEAFRSSLPIGGVDGSLGGRFHTRLLYGKVFAKTGTLDEVNALSGYLVAASGRTVIFSILCNDHLPANAETLETMDKIVAAIAQRN